MARDRGGQVMVMMPVILMVLLLLFGGTYDIVRFIVITHDIQNAADAASLAGASEVDVIEYNSQGQYIGPTIQIDPTAAYNEATLLFNDNLSLTALPGNTGVAISPTFQVMSPTQYQVSVQASIPTVFLSTFKFFGNGPVMIHASIVSEAQVLP